MTRYHDGDCCRPPHYFDGSCKGEINKCVNCNCKIRDSHNECQFCNCNQRQEKNEIRREEFYANISSIAVNIERIANITVKLCGTKNENNSK